VPLLLCDLDDTVLDRAGTFEVWVQRFLRGRGLDPGLRDWLVVEDDQGRRPRAELFAAVRGRAGIADPVEGLVESFYRDFAALFHCAPAVGAALERARGAGWRIALVTNGTAAQELKILASGLDALVDGWAVSGKEGTYKPQVRLLQIAAERVGEPLASAWMVGDSPEADIGAAQAAGIPSVWLRRGRRWPLSTFRPTLEADTFPAAVDLVLAASGGGVVAGTGGPTS
jgi:putative hydrolase of the HAD superfamily